MPSTTHACCRSRRRAGRRTTRRSSAFRRRTTCPRRFRTARGLRRSGIRRARKRAKPRSPARRSQTCGKRAPWRWTTRSSSNSIVGKTFKVRNTVTGQRFEILYGLDGRRLILSVDGKQPPAGEVGDVLHSGELGSPAQYEVRGGKIVTTLAGHAVRDHGVQGRRQVCRGTQQRVRLRQLRGRVDRRALVGEALVARAAAAVPRRRRAVVRRLSGAASRSLRARPTTIVSR